MKIEKIIEQNKWWILGKNFANEDKQLIDLNKAFIKIKRNIDLIEPKKEYIYIIYGPRRVGKTTFIKQTIYNLLEKGVEKEKIAYFSCDIVTTNKKEELYETLNFLLERNIEFIFIDEINVIKGWEEVIRYYFDNGKFANITVVITGSPFGIKEMLPGRNVIKLFMKPITFRDFIKNLVDNISNVELQKVLSTKLGFSNEEIKILQNLKKELEKVKLDENSISNFDNIEKNVNATLKFLSILKKLFNIYVYTGGFPCVINNYLKF